MENLCLASISSVWSRGYSGRAEGEHLASHHWVVCLSCWSMCPCLGNTPYSTHRQCLANPALTPLSSLVYMMSMAFLNQVDNSSSICVLTSPFSRWPCCLLWTSCYGSSSKMYLYAILPNLQALLIATLFIILSWPADFFRTLKYFFLLSLFTNLCSFMTSHIFPHDTVISVYDISSLR